MRYGKDTLKQANDLIEAMRRAHVPAFNDQVFGLADRYMIQDLIRMAKRYNKIQEHDCNGTKTKRMATEEANLEIKIRAWCDEYGLTVHFDGDPRGYCVKLYAWSQDVYNTGGGRESGYGIG